MKVLVVHDSRQYNGGEKSVFEAETILFMRGGEDGQPDYFYGTDINAKTGYLLQAAPQASLAKCFMALYRIVGGVDEKN